MRLSEEVLIEIVDIVRNGILNGVDISDQLRQLELKQGDPDSGAEETLFLTDQFKKSKGR